MEYTSGHDCQALIAMRSLDWSDLLRFASETGIITTKACETAHGEYPNGSGSRATPGRYLLCVEVALCQLTR